MSELLLLFYFILLLCIITLLIFLALSGAEERGVEWSVLTESERLVVEKATEVFGDSEVALGWLKRRHYDYGGKAPIEVVDTPEGFDKVMAQLGRIEHGVYS